MPPIFRRKRKPPALTIVQAERMLRDAIIQVCIHGSIKYAVNRMAEYSELLTDERSLFRQAMLETIKERKQDV